MTYQETLDFLYAQLPMYQRQGKSALKKDLTNTFALSKFLGKPELKFKSIHIAGTNGKGSTAHILAAMYRSNGYKTGLYTSPHLLDFRERIKINGEAVEEEFVVRFVQKVKTVIDKIRPSFFELTVAMAFDYFAEQKVDVAIIETGLGGRLDSTNILIPELSIVTSIGFDHMDMLGNDLASIAAEKAGIIKFGKPVVIGLLPEEAEEVIRETAKERHSLFHDAIRTPHRLTAHGLITTDLNGGYQQLNIKTALIAVDALQHLWPTSDENNSMALMNVCSLSGLRGRWDVLSEEPLIIADVAHNEEGLSNNMGQIKQLERSTHFILGFVEDKPLDSIISLFPKEARYSFVKPEVVRGLDANKLQAQFATEGRNGKGFKNLSEAINNAIEDVEDKKCELIYIGGSNFIIADVLLLEQQGQLPF